MAYCILSGIGDNELLDSIWEIDVYLEIRESPIRLDTISKLRQLKAMIHQYNIEFHSKKLNQNIDTTDA